MATAFGKKLKALDMSEIKTITGVSFIIYGASASRKTRCLGTLPGKTHHLSLDYGSTSAIKARDMLGIDSEHIVVPIKNLADISEALITLKSDKSIASTVDTVVFDSLRELNEMVFAAVSRLPRFAKDQATADDIMKDNPDKNAAASKTMALYNEVQKLTKEIVLQLLDLKARYNVNILADEVNITDSAIEPDGEIIYPKVNGPRSVKPVVGLVDEVYRMVFDVDVLDTKDRINTAFGIRRMVNDMTNMRIFGKTRYITDTTALKTGKVTADFRGIFKHTGYICKKDR